MVNPFPVRASGQRFEDPLADSLGANAILGSSFAWENPNRQHARVQRWRFGVQREFFGNTSVEVAYSGQYADRVDRSISSWSSHFPEELLRWRQRSRRVGADAAAAAGHESVSHRQFRIAENLGPGALRPHGEQRVLPGPDDAAGEFDSPVSAPQRQPADGGVVGPGSRNEQPGRSAW